MLGRLTSRNIVRALDLARHEKVGSGVNIEHVACAVCNVGELVCARLARPFRDVPLLGLVRLRFSQAPSCATGMNLRRAPAHGKLLAHAGRTESHEIPASVIWHGLKLPHRICLAKNPKAIVGILQVVVEWC